MWSNQSHASGGNAKEGFSASSLWLRWVKERKKDQSSQPTFSIRSDTHTVTPTRQLSWLNPPVPVTDSLDLWSAEKKRENCLSFPLGDWHVTQQNLLTVRCPSHTSKVFNCTQLNTLVLSLSLSPYFIILPWTTTSQTNLLEQKNTKRLIDSYYQESPSKPSMRRPSSITIRHSTSPTFPGQPWHLSRATTAASGNQRFV